MKIPYGRWIHLSWFCETPGKDYILKCISQLGLTGYKEYLLAAEHTPQGLRCHVGLHKEDGHTRNFLDIRILQEASKIGLNGFSLDKRKSWTTVVRKLTEPHFFPISGAAIPKAIPDISYTPTNPNIRDGDITDVNIGDVKPTKGEGLKHLEDRLGSGSPYEGTDTRGKGVSPGIQASKIRETLNEAPYGPSVPDGEVGDIIRVDNLNVGTYSAELSSIARYLSHLVKILGNPGKPIVDSSPRSILLGHSNNPKEPNSVTPETSLLLQRLETIELRLSDLEVNNSNPGPQGIEKRYVPVRRGYQPQSETRSPTDLDEWLISEASRFLESGGRYTDFYRKHNLYRRGNVLRERIRELFEVPRSV